MTVEVFIGKLIAWYISAVVVVFFVAIIFIAISPILAGIYVIADWYDKRSSRDTFLNSQAEAGTTLRICSSVHNSQC